MVICPPERDECHAIDRTNIETIELIRNTETQILLTVIETAKRAWRRICNANRNRTIVELKTIDDISKLPGRGMNLAPGCTKQTLLKRYTKKKQINNRSFAASFPRCGRIPIQRRRRSQRAHAPARRSSPRRSHLLSAQTNKHEQHQRSLFVDRAHRTAILFDVFSSFVRW